MKLLSTLQIRELDKATIKIQNILSADLMKRASRVYFMGLMEHIKGKFNEVVIMAGSGNNGGDGVAVASLCAPYFDNVTVVLCNIGPRSQDLLIMLDELDDRVKVHELNEDDEFSFSLKGMLVVDAIFGSGLSREISGYWSDVVSYVNNNSGYICSIDVPSGLYSDKLNESNSIIKSNWTLALELPKKSFFFQENDVYLGDWHYSSIGLDEPTMNNMDSQDYLIDNDLINTIFVKRQKHAHKGTFGHAALITGSYGMSGASILSARACLRAGVGKLSCYVPEVGLDLIQSGVPEAICTGNNGYQCIESIHLAYDHQAIGLGCGIGKNVVTRNAIKELFLHRPEEKMIIDADALNIIAEESWLGLIPKGSLITPHLGEFRRLFGTSLNSEETFKIQQLKSEEHNIYILLKGANTRITCPEGGVYYNKTGNPGMATAGSGDVLTGIITGILAQGYSMRDAAVLGTYVHGLAGDIAASEQGEYGLIASDLIDFLPKAFRIIENRIDK